jgi:hypothetical protein
MTKTNNRTIAHDSAIPTVTIRIPMPKNTKAPAKAVSKTASR